MHVRLKSTRKKIFKEEKRTHQVRSNLRKLPTRDAFRLWVESRSRPARTVGGSGVDTETKKLIL